MCERCTIDIAHCVTRTSIYLIYINICMSLISIQYPCKAEVWYMDIISINLNIYIESTFHENLGIDINIAYTRYRHLV